jgi:GT2 family glycosyltransferase
VTAATKSHVEPHYVIDVVVPVYNAPDDVRTCVGSVLDHLRPDVRVVLIDDASPDPRIAPIFADLVQRAHPQLVLLRNDTNLGFTGGNNAALAELGFAAARRTGPWRHAAAAASPDPDPDRRPDYVLLLNPDAELKPGALAALVEVLASKPRAGACGARLEYPDGSFQHGAFAFPTLAQVALDFLPVTAVRGAHRLLDSRVNGRYPRALWAGGAPFRVDFVLGAALCVRAEAIDVAGALDDGYWMYGEEMDWCLRLAYYGYGVWAVPAARVVHHAGQSSQQVRWRSFERLWRSRFRFYARHPGYYGPLHLALVRLLVRAGTAHMRRTAETQFARGEIDGITLGEALAALDAVGTL